jgi:hypothetical protein
MENYAAWPDLTDRPLKNPDLELDLMAVPLSDMQGLQLWKNLASSDQILFFPIQVLNQQN